MSERNGASVTASSRTPRVQGGDFAFLAGGGEMGAALRNLDWSTSPLGSPADWPQALRTTVSLLLNSKFPMFVAWGPELGFLYNDVYVPILGDKHPLSVGARFQDIWREIWPDVSPLVAKAMAGEATWLENLPLTMNRHGYAEETWFTFSYSPVQDDDGRVAGVFCACTETTRQVLGDRALREREASLAEALEVREGLLAEKDLLLAEVNHRVKNSLQLVVSTLSLQSRRLTDEASKAAFEQAISRVRAITSVHERLYKTGSPLVVEMGSYLRGLADDLAGTPELRERMDVRVDGVSLPTERAIPLAIVVNELVTNSMKYAYPADRPGPIVLSLTRVDDIMLELTVADEGAGAEAASGHVGLGSRLIQTMATQLDGRLERRVTSDGYRVSLLFSGEAV